MRAFLGVRRLAAVFALLAACILSGCSSGSSGEPTPPAPTPTIAVTASPAAVNVTPGQSVTTAVTLSRGGGYNGTASLTLDGAPAGLTGTFAPASVAAGQTSSMLTLTAAPTAAVGTHAVTVRGTGQNVAAATTAIAVTVQGASSIAVSLDPNAVTIAQGASSTVPIQIARTNFSGEVSLAVSGAPSGVTASVSPTPTTTNAATLTVTAGPGATPGAHTLTVTATAQGLAAATASLTVTLVQASAISLALTPASLTLAQGTSGTSAVQITRTNVPGAVALSVAGMPSGVTASVAPASVTDNAATLTVNVGATAATGTHTLTVTGQAEGAANATATLSLIVTASGGVWAQISAGFRHTCGITNSGDAYCWGHNGFGQLGVGNQTNQIRPLLVAGGHKWASISAGGHHTCGITTNGAAHCWGIGTSGQLGNGSTTASQTTPIPVTISGGDTWAMISAGEVHTCAIASDGRLFCWGDNGSGQLGDGTVTRRTTRSLVAGGRRWRTVGAGGGVVGRHTCGVTTGGEAFCWGNNQFGQLGDGSSGLGPNSLPVAVIGGRSWTSLAAGYGYTCGVSTSGDAYCWGWNDSRQLGKVSTSGQSPTPTPTLVLGDHTWTQVSAGASVTCGLTPNGAAYCWGANAFGQAGTGNTGGFQTAPALVADGHHWAVADAGSGYNCGRTVTGQGYCWGGGDVGQLGAGSTLISSTPLRISDP